MVLSDTACIKLKEVAMYKKRNRWQELKRIIFFSKTKYKHFQESNFQHHLRHKISISLGSSGQNLHLTFICPKLIHWKGRVVTNLPLVRFLTLSPTAVMPRS